MLATRELMEEFRGLLNLEVPERKLLSFVFFGLPEIEQNLKLDPPLAQRVALRYRLEPLVRGVHRGLHPPPAPARRRAARPVHAGGHRRASTPTRAARRASSTPCATTRSSRASWRARERSTSGSSTASRATSASSASRAADARPGGARRERLDLAEIDRYLESLK